MAVLLRALAVAAAVATPLARAQAAPSVHAAFAAEREGAAPALAWLRHHLLATRPEWPAGLSRSAAFTLHLHQGRLSFGPGLQLPAAVAVAGEIAADGTTIRFACRDDGRDDWDIEGDTVPAAARPLIAALHLDAAGGPRTLDVPALVGNVVGAVVEGDAHAQQIALGAGHCGELTLAVQRGRGRLRVEGRSGGGLVVPALLLFLAQERDAAVTLAGAHDGWRLRAFGSRDGDRAEAARQMQRAGGDAVPVLASLLHADEHSRVCAIDGLLRLRAAAELPRIAAAAEPDLPLATAMARTAVRELWPLASAATRQRTRAVLQRSAALDESILDDAPPADAARYRWLAALAVVFTGLFGLWRRERARPVSLG